MSIICFFKQKTAYELRISDWSSDVCSSDLLDFWLGSGTEVWPPAQVSKRWFNSTHKDDELMAERFGELVEEALAGGLPQWEENAASRIALILLLDQLPRNIFRGSARAFDGDGRAAALVAAGVTNGKIRRASCRERVCQA